MQTNPLPHLFIGEWNVQSRTKTSNPLQNVTIEAATSEPNPTTFKVHLIAKDNQPQELQMDCQGDGTLRSTDEHHPLCISFWRYPSYDIIFGLLKEPDGASKEVWNARRIVDDTTASKPEKAALASPESKIWKIRLSEGNQAAPLEHYVTMKEFRETSRGGDALYGLFQMEEIGGEENLYDILFYDEVVKAYNSVFGVRSVRFWMAETADPQDARVFATFDNRSSLPVSHFSTGHPNLGRLLPVEKAVITRAHALLASGNTGSEEDDPDVGVWVGEPP